jgi:hypothetical protein
MQPIRKRLPTDSPRKIQMDMTSFIGKRFVNKTMPTRSYAQVATGNRYEALSDPDDDEDVDMEDTSTGESSE